MSEAEANTPRESTIAALGAVTLSIVLLAAYSNHFQNSFHFDDLHTITDNPAIRSLANVPGFTADLAAEAVRYRQDYGGFTNTKQLVDVLGMSQADYSVARRYLRV